MKINKMSNDYLLLLEKIQKRSVENRSYTPHNCSKYPS